MPKSSTSDCTTMTTAATSQPVGSNKAKGRTTNEFRVPICATAIKNTISASSGTGHQAIVSLDPSAFGCASIQRSASTAPAKGTSTINTAGASVAQSHEAGLCASAISHR